MDVKNDILTRWGAADDLKLKLLPSCDLDVSKWWRVQPTASTDSVKPFSSDVLTKHRWLRRKAYHRLTHRLERISKAEAN